MGENTLADLDPSSEQRTGPVESAAVLAGSDDDLTIPDPVIYKGTDRPIRMPSTEEPVRFVGEDVSLNFEAAPLSEVVHAVIGDILGLDYIVDGPVNGTVTLRTRTPIPRDELLVVLESLLKANNILMIRGDTGRYLITASNQASRLYPDVGSPQDTAAGYSTIIVPLQYISASGMAEILKPLAEEEAFVRVDNTRNLLMLAGTRTQLRGWLEIVETFDVDRLKGMSVGLFPLENSGVEETAEALNALLGADGVGGASDEDDFGQLVRIIPFERLNSILVVTPRAYYLEVMGTWIERLDTPETAGGEKRLFVYPVQNTTAGRLADLLNSIYSRGGNQASQQGSRAQGGVAPGLNQESINSGRARGNSSGTGRTSGGGSNRLAAVSMGLDGNPLAEDVRVVADEENNSLMIYATGVQYKLIKSALEKLDTVATQVMIEASIIEVQLTDELRYGLEWTFKGGLGDNYGGVGVLADAAAGPARIAPGFSYTITNSIGDVSAVLNALSQKSLVNIISTPSVMVLDNNSAFIQVGEQIPVRRGTTVTNGGTTTENIEYRDTGVLLDVKPSVNAGGLITMDIEQSVTDVGQLDVGGNRRFLNREIKSRVAVRSGESVVLGGLIRENVSNSDDGVPFLHTVPVLGSLFGTTENSDNRTELIVIITPRALYNETDLRQVSDEMKAKVRDLRLLEEKGAWR
ncbi:type II secretion system protein GspD [Halioglobus pacificus]|uniref:Type II secretion system protein GspD n=1 Tax=Parahalioglobus pacificus TaxID=930806 RepID=A0A919CMN1_9GAMM|nr:type II secretion system protein GspD [Halioglobus pacificus]